MHLGLSHLREHNFKHCFQDCLNPICACGYEIETITQLITTHITVWSTQTKEWPYWMKSGISTLLILEQNDTIIFQRPLWMYIPWWYSSFRCNSWPSYLSQKISFFYFCSIVYTILLFFYHILVIVWCVII